jgi:hypothetical protein
MDFLDPKKQRLHTIRLIVGYVLVSLAIIIATVVLLYQAYGFGLGKDNEVVQNGFVFVSTHPNPAKIYLNGQLNKSTTNIRLTLVSGQYYMELKRSGYRTWQREITVVGGMVEHYDYPFLFPQKLITSPVKSYDAAPSLATQSPDHRWLIVSQPGTSDSFDEYDLKNPKLAPVTLTMPSTVAATAKTSESWQLSEWSDDNRHVLLQHLFDGSSEYVMLDRQDPTQSFNLTKTLGVNPTKVSLRDKKYDQYYLYDGTAHTLQTVTLNSPTPVNFLSNVYGYKSYGANTMLYVTADNAPAGKVAVDLLQDGTKYQLRTVAADPGAYLLDLAQHGGTWFVAAGSSAEGRVYVYKNPATQLQSSTSKTPVAVPVQVLKAKSPTYLAFSANTQFIMDEGGTDFSVYDVQNDSGYNYTVASSLDAPQTHAAWMDGDRLEYVSGGKLIVFDFDRANIQTLMPANPSYLPFYDPAYKFVDAIAPTGADGKQTDLDSTALLIPADQ